VKNVVRAENFKKLRIKTNFPRKGEDGIKAIIFLHITLVSFFKTFTEEKIRELNEDLIAEGKKFFKDSAEDCRVNIKEETGLWSWSCPGNACGFSPYHYDKVHMELENKEWIQYIPHNIDKPGQLVFLLAAASMFCDLERRKDSS